MTHVNTEMYNNHRAYCVAPLIVLVCLVLGAVLILWVCQRALRESKALAEGDKLRWVTADAAAYIQEQVEKGIFGNAALSNITSLSVIPLRQDIPPSMRKAQGSYATNSLTGEAYHYSPVTQCGEVLFLQEPDIWHGEYRPSTNFWMWTSTRSSGMWVFVMTDGVTLRLYENQVDWCHQTVQDWSASSRTESLPVCPTSQVRQ